MRRMFDRKLLIFLAVFVIAGFYSLSSLTDQIGGKNASSVSISPDDLTIANEAIKNRAVQNYGKLPLRFEKNQGQTDAQVQFFTRGRGYAMFLTGTEAVLSLRRASDVQDEAGVSKNDAGVTDVVRVQLVDSNPNPEVTGQDVLPGKSNYLKGNDPSKWRTNIDNYKKVAYKDVYAGIDLVYYGTEAGLLEHDFVVSPGVDPDQIRFVMKGAESLRLGETGNLIVSTLGGDVTFNAPVTYQDIDGTRQPVESHYVLASAEGVEQVVGFELGSYDDAHPVVIDPVLSYATFLGGSGLDEGLAIAVDGSGNAYVTGFTPSTNFPLASAYQSTYGGGSQDVFITKLNSAGSALVYSTYLGGSGNDTGYGIAVDGSDNVYVTGLTTSTNFPTSSAFQPSNGGGDDAFVTKLNSAGSALVYSTYLGGSSGDQSRGITVDGSGNAYVTGFTSSSNYPLASAYQSTYGGSQDVFITKLNSAGSALVYSTYLGGSGNDTGYGIAVDGSDNAHVTGYTSSSNFPTSSAFQSSNGGSDDVFITKLNSAGSALMYSTYLGGSAVDQSRGIALDGSGNAYITGYTRSSNFPTSSAFQLTHAGGTDDGFVTKLSSAGSALAYSTYLGGSDGDFAFGIAVDGLGKAFVTGYTGSSNFPTQSAHQSTHGGNNDVFVTVLSSGGATLDYSTYLGGTGRDDGRGIALDGSGNAVVTGWTNGSSFPTQSAYQPTFAGVEDVVLAKFTGFSVFEEVGASAGISFLGGLGTAWGDFDNDGDLDLYISTNGPNALYRNEGNGTFTNIQASAGVGDGAIGSGVAWGDYDNDGNLDLYLSNFGSASKLYRNNGNATFTEVGASAGVNNVGSGQGVAWGDYDGDGYLDLYLNRSSANGNRLFHNNGNGTFSDVSIAVGIKNGNAGLNAAWADYDNDGDLDVYQTSLSGQTSFLYRNNGNATFTEVGASAGVNNVGNGTSVSWGDYDNDGHLDLYVVNSGSANKLYRNNGNGTFTDMGSSAGVDDAGPGESASWGDYDNDGDIDLYLANNGTANKLYRNNNNGTFTDVGANEGVNDTGVGMGISWGDYDNDGDLDIYLSNNNVSQVGLLYRNNGNANNWLTVKLVGSVSNRSAIGAKVTAVTGALSQRHDVGSGPSNRSQASLPVEFGLGSTTTVDALTVQWPSGIVQTLNNVTTNQMLTITEEGLVVSIPDTVGTYETTVNVPVRISDATGLSVVAAELLIAYDRTIVTPGSPDRTNFGALTASGWSIEDNVLIGSGTIDTLSIALSTAADTLAGSGELVSVVFDVANIRQPASTALELVGVLFNDGTPTATTVDGSLTVLGTNGTLIATPDSIHPADVVSITVTDVDLDIDVGAADQVSATAVSALYGDTQTVTLTETGINTGIFTGTVNTAFSLVADPSENGAIGTIAGDSILVSYTDVLDALGATVVRADTVEVVGGVDGVVVASYVVQAFDGRDGIRDTVRVEVADADLDIDVGVAEQVSATITNVISSEVETVTLIETGVNTGIFQVRVPTIAGASGTNEDGVLSLASWDTLDVSYTDNLTAQGGVAPVVDTTRVVNLFGDVQSNDQIQAFDAARLLAISVGLVSSNTQTTLVGDVDGGGAIQAFDASLVLQYVVRLIDRFPVQTDFTADPKNHPFEKPALGSVIALGDMNKQSDGTYLIPVQLSERASVLSGTLTFGVDAGIEIVDVDMANDYGSFMTAHNMTTEGLKVAFAGSQSELSGSGDVLLLKVRGVEGTPIRLSLDQVTLNGQSLTPSVNIEAMETVETPVSAFITELHQNLPNPFNPETTIRYGLAEAGQVSVVIYSVTGQRVRTLVSAFQGAGAYQVSWNGQDALGNQVSSGVYLMRMQATGFVQTKKMLLMK